MMLILSRKKSQVITIGDNVKITVVSVRGNRVQVGIEAPKGVSVNRLEVQESKDKEVKP
jgi:carbon storage regulator